GTTIALAGATLARFGHLALPAVIRVASTGAILGDNIGFFIGRRGGRVLLERRGRLFGLTPARIAQFDGFFARHGAKTVFIARFVTGLRVVGAILAGASTLPWGRFLFFNAAGAVAWSVMFVSVGYLLGYSWETFVQWICRLGLAMLLVVAAEGTVPLS